MSFNKEEYDKLQIQKEKVDLKKLDRLYNKIIKFVDEDVAVKILTLIKKNGFLESLLFAIRIEDIKIAHVIFEAAFTIEHFKDLIRKNMSIIIMAGLNSGQSMKLVLEAELKYSPIPLSGKMTEQMILCVYRHSFTFPENKEICYNYVKSYDIEACFLQRPFSFINDDVDIIQKYLKKDDQTKALVISNAIDSGSVKTLNKIKKYYNLKINLIGSLPLPILLENPKDFDIKNESHKDTLLHEVCMNNKWEFIPYIFENTKLEGADWVHFNFTLTQGIMYYEFFRTLVYYMEKHGYSYDLLYDEEVTSVFCNTKIMSELVKINTFKKCNFNNNIVHKKSKPNNISNLFNYYMNGNVEIIKTYFFMSYAHKNHKVTSEIKQCLDLVQAKKLNWDDDLYDEFNKFCDFCDDFFTKLDYCDILILEYNSYITTKILFTDLMNMRFLNRIRKVIRQIDDDMLYNEHKVIIASYYNDYDDTLQQVREHIGIDCPHGERWELPEDPSLRDLFSLVYQYCAYTYDDPKYKYINKAADILRERKMFKIADEVEKAVASLVPAEEIFKILTIRNINFDFGFDFS